MFIDYKIKNKVILIASMLLAMACTSDIDEVGGRNDVPIRLGVTVEEPATETIVNGTTRAGTAVQSTVLANGEPVDVYVKNASTDAFIANPIECTVSGNTGNLTATNLLYPGGGSVTMYAVHPRHTSGTAFTVAYDQTTDAQYRNSDLTFSEAANYDYSTSVHILPMTHLMAKIIVNVNVPTASPAWTVADLKLHAKRSVVMTYPTVDAGGYTFGALSDDGEIILDNEGAVLIPPQTIASGTSFITFNVPGVGPYTYRLPADQDFEAGHQYTYTLTPTAYFLEYAKTKVGFCLSLGGTMTNILTHVGNATVVYTSSNPAVATVNSTTGEVTPLTLGTTTITATIADGQDKRYTAKSASYELYVVKLPIEYVAPYNMYNSTNMAPNNYPTNSAYFDWATACSNFDKHFTLKNYSGTNLSGKYHLPSIQEWMSIAAPSFITSYYNHSEIEVDGETTSRIIYGNTVFNQQGLGEKVQWGKKSDNSWVVPSTKFYNEYATNPSYNSTANGVTRKNGYAIRLKDTDVAGPRGYGKYTCAYRYTYTDKDPDCNNNASLRIKVRYLGPSSSTSLSDITNDLYWNEVGTKYYEVILPSCGNKSTNTAAGGFTSASDPTSGQYWSSTKRDNVTTYGAINCRPFAMYSLPNTLRGNDWCNTDYTGFPIRLFKDE